MGELDLSSETAEDDDVVDADEEAGDAVFPEETEEAKPLSGEAHAWRFVRRRTSLRALGLAPPLASVGCR
jgi:hypothetical protein